MKLLHKTTLLYLLATTLILVAAGVTLMLVLRGLVDDEIDEELRLQYDLIVEQIRGGELPNVPLTTIAQVSQGPTAELFGDSLVYDRVQHLHEEYKYLRKTSTINGQNYQIMVMDAHVGWQEFFRTIFLVFLVMAASLVLAGAIINYLAARSIWRPFFQNLNILKQFSVSAPQPMQLQKSSIREFEELREVLEEMTHKSWQEFSSLREFTENASHETQTPLAIIRSKLDRLSQYPVSEEMAEHIVHAKSGVDRLSRMNKSLLLLAKLDNNAFTDKQELNLCEKLQEQAGQMEELFTLRNITLELSCERVRMRANTYLCEVLISNLLANAVHYTPEGGTVSGALTKDKLVFRNTGQPIGLDSAQLFKRFRKGQQSNHSTGLGLAIVQQICQVHGWRVNYGYQTGWHTFTISF
ncbi:sensor histidine kinase [Pontibacter oryzae]|nr:HAMP domain-containing sensor histidine kinase [Pontibacter oryzae]